jgi:hypothetical protein
MDGQEMVDIFHVPLHKATWFQGQLTCLLQVVVPRVVQRMAMAIQNHPHVAPVTANQNLHHATLATINLHLLPVEQVKVTTNLKPQPAVPHAEPVETKDSKVPGRVMTNRELS